MALIDRYNFSSDGLTVVHGACPKGADFLASLVVQECASEGRQMAEEAHPADWDTYGITAGFRRNAEMVELGADVCLAFFAGPSKGTKHCSNLAKKAGIEVIPHYEEVEA